MSMNHDTLSEIYKQFQEEFAKNVKALEASRHTHLSQMMQSRLYGIFYNDPRHTLCKGKVYLVGYNPGGPDNVDKPYEEDNLDWWHSIDCQLYSSYIDEAWDREAGQAQHQINVRKVLHQIMKGESEDTDTRHAFAANLCFYRTPDLRSLLEYPIFEDLIRQCWQFHLKFLNIVRPEIIVCNGNAEIGSPFAFVRDKLQPQHAECNVALNKRRSVKSFRSKLPVQNEDLDVLVIGVPHLSRPYASIDAICDAIEIILKTVPCG
jgi:hypothetical protein